MNKRIIDGLIIVAFLTAFTHAAGAAVPVNVPDAGATSGLVIIGVGALALVRNLIR